jgi:hypothetical protein
MLVLLAVGATWAASTYNTSIVSINVGNPGWASFYFETVPGYTGPGWEGSSALIIQCNFSRAELITGFDVYGKQASSQFFPINCTPSETVVNGYNVYHETLNNTPFTVNLTMYSYNGPTSPLTLTVGATEWQERLCGRYCNHEDAGSSQISY